MKGTVKAKQRGVFEKVSGGYVSPMDRVVSEEKRSGLKARRFNCTCAERIRCVNRLNCLTICAQLSGFLISL
jgi:hypothetical protein